MSCARKDYNGWGCWLVRTVIQTLLFVAAFAAWTSYNERGPQCVEYWAEPTTGIVHTHQGDCE